MSYIRIRRYKDSYYLFYGYASGQRTVFLGTSWRKDEVWVFDNQETSIDFDSIFYVISHVQRQWISSIHRSRDFDEKSLKIPKHTGVIMAKKEDLKNRYQPLPHIRKDHYE